MSERVTLKDIYAVVNRLEDKMDDQFKAQETRINSLETSRDYIAGGLGILGLFSSGFAVWVWRKLTGTT